MAVFTFILSLFMVSTLSFAHSGRTDAAGGHRDNKNVSGLGSYHYHHGYPAHLHPNGVCPYSAAPVPSESSVSSTPAITTPPKEAEPPKTESKNTAPVTDPIPANATEKQSPEILTLKAASKTPKPAFTSTGLKTNDEKAVFLDHYIAILTTSDVYHTIDCQDFDQYSAFAACDVSRALQQGYVPCPKCHK